jgi:uncharacterized membrane protein
MWSHYVALAGLATFKFMFAPIYGRGVGMSFMETYLCTFIGALLAAVFFYLLAGFFMARASRKRMKKRLDALYHGYVWVEPRRFTRINKLVVFVKRKIGIYGIALYAPFFLSVPLGTIITVKFFGRNKKTFPIIVAGLAKNSLITTSIVYFAWW